MNYNIKSIYKLTDELQENLVEGQPFTKPHYDKLEYVARHIHQGYKKDLYMLEPHGFYYIELVKCNKPASKVFYYKEFLLFGVLIEVVDDKIFLFNTSENQIYIDGQLNIVV